MSRSEQLWHGPGASRGQPARPRKETKRGLHLAGPRVDGLVRAIQHAYRFTQYSTHACDSNVESHNGGECVEQCDRGTVCKRPMLKHAEPVRDRGLPHA